MKKETNLPKRKLHKLCLQKTSQKIENTNFRGLAIEEPVFTVASTEFEGGCNGYGFSDCIFLVIYCQPGHTVVRDVSGLLDSFSIPFRT